MQFAKAPLNPRFASIARNTVDTQSIYLVIL